MLHPRARFQLAWESGSAYEDWFFNSDTVDCDQDCVHRWENEKENAHSGHVRAEVCIVTGECGGLPGNCRESPPLPQTPKSKPHTYLPLRARSASSLTSPWAHESVPRCLFACLWWVHGGLEDPNDSLFVSKENLAPFAALKSEPTGSNPHLNKIGPKRSSPSKQQNSTLWSYCLDLAPNTPQEIAQSPASNVSRTPLPKTLPVNPCPLGLFSQSILTSAMGRFSPHHRRKRTCWTMASRVWCKGARAEGHQNKDMFCISPNQLSTESFLLQKWINI